MQLILSEELGCSFISLRFAGPGEICLRPQSGPEGLRDRLRAEAPHLSVLPDGRAENNAFSELEDSSGGADHKGLLSRQTKDGWKEYFFLLTKAGVMLYFADEAAYKSGRGLGYLDLSNLDTAKTTGSESGLSTFELRISQGRVWRLGAADPVDAILWLNVLTSRKKPLPKKGPKPFTPSAPSREELQIVDRLEKQLSCFASDATVVDDLDGGLNQLTSALLALMDEADAKEQRRPTSLMIADKLSEMEAEIFADADDDEFERAVHQAVSMRARAPTPEARALCAAQLRNTLNHTLKRPPALIGRRRRAVPEKAQPPTLRLDEGTAGDLLATLAAMHDNADDDEEEEEEDL